MAHSCAKVWKNSSPTNVAKMSQKKINKIKAKVEEIISEGSSSSGFHKNPTG